MSKIGLAVHRAGSKASGGSERNVHLYATALNEMGHDVTILTNTIDGGYVNGIRITNTNILVEDFDLMIVHGDCNIQNVILSQKWQFPVLYLVVRADEKLPIIMTGMKNATKIGCATKNDMELAKKYGCEDKIITIRYPVLCPTITLSKEEIREKFNITKEKVYLSIGGFWPHKNYKETANAFIDANLENTEMIFTGYDTRFENIDYQKMGEVANIKIQQFYLENQQDVYELMSIADLLIVNSEPSMEGFCLSLCESMILKCPWIARKGIPAADMYEHLCGRTYENYDTLVDFMRNPLTYDKTYLQQISGYIQELHDPDSAANSLLQFEGIK